jgi:hypothetical protein
MGICFIYGFRMWQDAPIDPSFVPIVGGSFAATLAFTLVISFEIATGPIKIHAGKAKFEGASGPIIFWCICFFTIVMGLYFLGLPDVLKLPPSEGGRSVLQLMQGK